MTSPYMRYRLCPLQEQYDPIDIYVFDQLSPRQHHTRHASSRHRLRHEAFLMQLTKQLDGRFVDPIKTTVVQNQRPMTSWVIGKSSK
jgi:hypothetical protein